MRAIAILLAVFLIGLGAWIFLRDDGVLEQVTEARVEQALLDNQVPPEMASCMAPRLTDRLSISQLRKLQRAAPQGDEARIPLSTGEALARLRRVEDSKAVKSVVTVAGGCGVELMMQNI